MAHKMGLAILDMTTGKSVPATVTWNYNNVDGTYTESGNGVGDPHTTIKPYHRFNTTTASDYCVPFNATTDNVNCYYIIKATGSTTGATAKFGCSTTETKEYWSDVSITATGYGKAVSNKITSDRDFANLIALFSCVRKCQTITLPWYGEYKMECWGASGSSTASSSGGVGGYTSGEMVLKYNKNLYLYVGECSGNNSYAGGWNGGGNGQSGSNTSQQGGCAGGGATDIRIIGGDWNNVKSLCSRIMVAGGGGGAGSTHSEGTGYGGYGGGIDGGDGYDPTRWGPTYFCGLGGTQTAGGKLGSGASSPGKDQTENNNVNAQNLNNGGFGLGGYNYGYDRGVTSYRGPGGGSGWYGGGGSNRGHGGGGGGSSFISGMSGCNGIDTSTGNHRGAGLPSVIDGITYDFSIISVPVMYAGNSASRPTNPGGVLGYAKITSQ